MSYAAHHLIKERGGSCIIPASSQRLCVMHCLSCVCSGGSSDINNYQDIEPFMKATGCLPSSPTAADNPSLISHGLLQGATQS